MPRRRGSKGKAGPSKPKRASKSDASMKKWNTADDIPLDEVDEFHSNRDKILLDGDGDDYMDGDEDDEVFALKGVEDEDSDEEEDEEAELGYDDDEDMEDIPEPPKEKKKGKKKAKGKGEISSDEEEEQEPEEESWGRGKAAYYNSNADELDSDDEEGHELEEQEAKRLQNKAREHMTDDDFGLNDIVEIQKDDIDMILEEPAAPPVVAPLPTEPQEIIRHLEKTNPEALALARDWEDTAEQLIHTEQKIKQVEAETPDALSLGMLHLHYQTLLSYTTVLAFYIHLRAMPKYAQKPSLLQSHPIMKRLLTLKQALITMEDLDFTMSDDEEDEFDDDMDAVNMKWDDILQDGEQLWDKVKKRGLEQDELAELLREAEEAADLLPRKAKKEKKEKSKEKEEPPKKKRKVQKDDSESAPVFDLVEPEFVSTSKSKASSSRPALVDDSYGEAQFLQHSDAADKAARKKSLQFHTSKIESASARRQSARNQAIGGDDDIPYRERAKEKALRLEREAKKRLERQGGADLDDVDPEPPSGKRPFQDDSDDDSESDGGNDYYELVKKKSKEKKEKKKAEYEAARAAEKFQVEEEDASGPRSLTRAILKNKGLTPHRSKAVRNPRVKKRQKYEQAKKKHASQKAVYKGGVAETKGRYDGERSGISKVIKSTRLG
ncbi:hypothetical protein CC1G_03470 [Coprinopsis cinerea okayama7|uniref:Sas10 C-terminal domain-containing protein n=1 Tax=Coprinopsis cinerea (strain Okayama-7 / 130 / ATCC MYA-4618 / FGSC 9003) TaxID=240176 RepID=A8NQU9_COPC7|nr:hypothetical protein CC1G_03470 [Coprinopsis cinerea okayama7\|eukprot:XP_001835688.1 hypothetical protein CC1G_03470 [Coprinopsis cinerea okayama7\